MESIVVFYIAFVLPLAYRRRKLTTGQAHSHE
jgi:hypothetical protein